MADSNIVITSTSPQGKVLQKTLTDINPDATNAQLATFGTMLNALTDNTYGKTTKITKVHCDAEAGGGDTRPVPTLEVYDMNKTNLMTEGSCQAGSQVMAFVKYTGDGQLFTDSPQPNCYINFATALQDNYIGTMFNVANNLGGDDVVFTIKTTATDNYQAAEIQFTVHITA